MAESHVINVISSPEATSFEYDVPGSQEILLKAIRGVWDGTGAADAFVPTVTIRTGAGRIISRSIADGVVAPGGGADVTFSPF